MKNVMLYLDENDLKEIEKITNNISAFVREAIKEKLGKRQKTLEEIRMLIKEKEEELDELRQLEAKLIQKELEKAKELENLRKAMEEERKRKFFELKSFVVSTEEFQKLKEEISKNPSVDLMDFVSKFREKYPNVKMGVSQLKEILGV